LLEELRYIRLAHTMLHPWAQSGHQSATLVLSK
jgi:hypothetical protein